MKKYYILLIGINLSTSLFSQVFTLVDSIQFTNAQIWGVLSDKGDSLCATTILTPGAKPHIFMRSIDYSNISQQSTTKQLTFDSDFTSLTNLTDHKSIILNDELYVAFSTQGDDDLFIFKTDINGNRIGSIVPVITGSMDPTNDMVLVTDGTSIFVLHFDPPFQQHVYEFDTDLNPIGTPFSTTTLDHNNIGNALFINDQFHMFSGDIYGLNADLIYTKWSNTWTPVSSQIVVPSTNGDGNWFSSGLIFDDLNQRWYVAMSHKEAGQSANQEHVDLIAFDDAFNILERLHVTSTNYTRPHLVLKNEMLYMTYDQPGGVYLHQYSVENVAGISEKSATENNISIYPNPANLSVNIHVTKPTTLSMVNLVGEEISSWKIDTSETIDVFNLQTGIYFVKDLETGSTVKFVKH